MSAKIPQKWLDLFELIPNYDPVATAVDGEWFDVEAAEYYIEFFETCLIHTQGEWAGEPMILAEWQRAVTGCIYGWKRADGTRRYREVLIYVPRKAGKSTWTAGFALAGLIIDKERGGQIYSLAADREQAALVFNQAKYMVESDPMMSAHLEPYKYSIVNPHTFSSYKYVSSDAGRKHGYNTSLGIVDELHVQPNRELVDVIKTSMGARRQPLMIYLTTADYSRPSICNETLSMGRQICEGTIQDSSFLPVIYEASLDDDWTDPEVWARVNPNYPITPKFEYLRDACNKAKAQPSFENTFKRLHLNIQTEQDKRWLQLHLWDECPSEPPSEEELLNHPCWGGIDLSSTTDLTAFALYWPALKFVKLWLWLPEDKMRDKRNQVIYGSWVSQGWVCKTPGSAVDYGYVREAVREAAYKYRIQDIGFDPWNATHFSQQLQEEDGLPMVKFSQGFAAMNEPSKALERMIIEKQLNHGGNPALRWMVSNVCAKTDPAGNIRPDKEHSNEKIDGVVAMIIAIGRALFSDDGGSVYEQRGILTL